MAFVHLNAYLGNARKHWRSLVIGIQTDVGFDVPKSCKDCWCNTGQCEDCIFKGSEQCVYPNKDKKIVIKEVKG